MFQSFKGATGLLIALLLSAGGAMAQSGTPFTNNQDINLNDQVTENTCSAGEPVALNGTVHITSSATTDSTGMNHFSITATNNLAGLGQSTGTAYAANDSDDYSSDNSDGAADMTVELKSQLNSQGSSPSMTLVQTLHMTVDGTGNLSGQVVKNATSCGN